MEDYLSTEHAVCSACLLTQPDLDESKRLAFEEEQGGDEEDAAAGSTAEGRVVAPHPRVKALHACEATLTQHINQFN